MEEKQSIEKYKVKVPCKLQAQPTYQREAL